jgi:hypothetical protein
LPRPHHLHGSAAALYVTFALPRPAHG